MRASPTTTPACQAGRTDRREFLRQSAVLAGGDTAKMWRNLLDCVRSRQEPYCPVSLGVRVQTPLIMGILSHRENKVALFEKATQRIVLE